MSIILFIDMWYFYEINRFNSINSSICNSQTIQYIDSFSHNFLFMIFCTNLRNGW